MFKFILGFTSYESPSGPSYPSHSVSHTAPASVHSHTYDIQSPSVSHVSNSYGAPIHVSAVSHSGSGHGGYLQPTYQSPHSSYGGPVDGIYFNDDFFLCCKYVIGWIGLCIERLLLVTNYVYIYVFTYYKTNDLKTCYYVINCIYKWWKLHRQI